MTCRIGFDAAFVAIFVVLALVAMRFGLGVPDTADGHSAAVRKRFERIEGSGDTAVTRGVDDDPAAGERVVSYVDRIVDRQINKVRGVLSFDALMLTFLGLLSRSGSSIDVSAHHLAPILTLMAALIAASTICLVQFRVRWGEVTDFETFSGEIKATLDLARRRSLWIERTVRLSILSQVGIVILVAATVAKV